MKAAKNKSEKTIIKKAKKNVAPKKKKLKPQIPAVENIADVQRLVELLQIHQIELEHQNEELRLMQEELEASRNKYVNLFDFSPIPYLTLDKHGIIKEVNLSASKMLGVDRNKLIDRSFTIYIPQDDKDIFNTFLNTVFNSLIKHSCEIKIVNKEKHVYQVFLEAIELDDPLGLVQKCQVAIIDLTEYKKTEDSKKVITEELKILNSTKDKIFSIIAHDLKSPFQGLLSSTELFATGIERLSDGEIKSFSRELNDSLKNLYNLIENLLQWSLLQRNALEYNPGNIILADEINKVIGILNRNAKAKNITLQNNVDAGIIVYADYDMLHSVIQNLLTNAIKFTHPEGSAIVSSVENNGFIEVSVQDSGMGIGSDKMSQLFSFHTIFTTKGTEGERGTGLGLSLCKEFIEKHGGKIWVESELGKGSKFTFTLRKTVS